MQPIIGKIVLLTLVVICSSSMVWADEIYKDKDGVWRNTDRGPSVSDGLNQLGNISGEDADRALFRFSEDASKSGPWKFYNDIWQGVGKELGERWKQRTQEDIERMNKERAAKKLAEEEKQKVHDPLSYERFDPATTGEVKSEWEFFDDPRKPDSKR